MNSKLYILIVFVLLAFACSSDDDTVQTIVKEVEVIESFDPIAIKLIHEDDGVEVLANECIAPDVAYAIEIEVKSNNKGNTAVSQIEYTINGVIHSMSFSQAGLKSNPIVLVDGKNSIELVKTAVSTEVVVVLQDEFELVE